MNNQLVVNKIVYDLDSYPSIVISKYTSRVKLGQTCYMLILMKDEYEPFSQRHTNLELSNLKDVEKDLIFEQVESYLLTYPKKIIRFDGCCFYPQSE